MASANRIAAISTIGAILVLGAALRAISLESDPPSYWTFGTGWGDEGPWNWPAAHRAVTGQWPPAGERFVKVGPLYVLLQAQIFGIVGVDLVRARLASVAAGVSTLAIVLWLGWHSLGPRGAWLAGLSYATLFWAVAFERLATPDALSLMVGMLALAILYQFDGPAAQTVAFLLAGVSAMTKFGMVFACLFVVLGCIALRRANLDPKSARRARPSIQLFALAVVALTLAVLSTQMLWASKTLRSSGWWFPLNAAEVAACVWRFVTAPFNGEFFLRMPVAVAGVVLLALPHQRLPTRARRLAMICAAWVVAWWAIVPIANLKGSRYYLLAAPVILLGTIGWAAVRVGESDRDDAPRWAVSPALAAGWLWVAALVGVWLSPRSGVRAAFWLLALIPSSLPLLRRLARPATAPEVSAWSMRTRGFIALIGLTLVAQLGAYGDWLRHRTTLVSTALSQFTEMSWLTGDICGGEAPTLLLGRPGVGEALYQVDFPDCRRDGRMAKYVVFAETSRCSPFESQWIGLQRSRFPALAQVGTVELPFEPLCGGHGRCVYRIAVLPPE